MNWQLPKSKPQHVLSRDRDGNYSLTMTEQPNPTVARRRLAVFFKSLREQRRRTQDEVASLLEVALSQASRLDTGARGYRPDDVRKLSAWYGLDGTTERSLLALADESKRRAWWQQTDLQPSYRTLIGMEQVASSIKEFSSVVVPGLLQTREYALSAAAASNIDARPEDIGPAIDIRMRRQEIIRRDQSPRLSVIMDEAVLARVTGGAEVMRRQLHHLLEIAVRPVVTIQVIGFEYGTHPGLLSNFILLEQLAEDLPDLVYIEELLEPSDSSNDVKVQQFRRTWEALSAIALSPRASLERIDGYARRL